MDLDLHSVLSPVARTCADAIRSRTGTLAVFMVDPEHPVMEE